MHWGSTRALRALAFVLGMSVLLVACDLPGPGGSPAAPAPGGASEAPSPSPSPEPSESASPEPEPSESASPTEPVEPSEPGGASEEPPAPDGYELVWSDEFDGTALDTARWNARDNTRVDYDLACITSDPDNLFVEDGVLVLRARQERDTCGSATRDYTVAYLDTIGKASFTYGRFEIRAKSPNGPDDSRGLWPAFWLRPDDGGNGEIDVVELPGGAQYYQAATQAIFHSYAPSTKQDNRHTFAEGYPGDGFHTYTTEWTPDALVWYIDGEEVYRRDRSTTPWFDDFHRPYNLRLNFQVGGWLGDPDASTVFPADFVVDYVRVWQR